MENPPQCRSHSANDFGFGDTTQLCTPISPLVAQSSSGSSQRWHGRHSVAARHSSWLRSLFLGMGRLKPQANRAEHHTERAEGGGEPEGGQRGRWRGCYRSSIPTRMFCSCNRRARRDVQEKKFSW